MADVSKIKLLDNSEYNIKDAFKSGIYVVKGTQTASTGTWTGALHGVSALYDGLTIMYYLPWAGSGNATLNLTLDDGTTTGAINCYYGNTTRLTTHYGKGNNIVMTYWSAGSISIDGTATTDNRWIANADYTVNDTAYYIRRAATNVLAGANKIFPYTVIMELADGRWESIVTSSSTGTGKARNTHGFRLGQVLLMYANATYDENARVANNNLWSQDTANIDARYSFNVANNTTAGFLNANKPVYLVGALANDGLFYLDTTWWTQTLPSTEDGKLYIHIGDCTDYYRMNFNEAKPIYHYSNGAVREFVQDAGSVNGHTVAKDVPANAVFTDNSGDDKLPLAGGTLTGPLGISYGTTATMTYNSTNPQIAFSENGQQGVKIIYSDYDSYRSPYGLKVIGNGSNTAGAWFEVEGDLYAKNLNATNVNANLNPEKITSGYLESRVYYNTHPENNGGIIPFIYNDIAFLTSKGGSYSFYSTTATDYTADTLSGTPITTSLVNAFDASPSYAGVNRPQTEVSVIDIICHKVFTYSNVFYIDFGASAWRAKSVTLLVRNSNTETTWTQKGTITNNAKGHWWLAVSHTSTSGGSTVQGFNQMRIILTDWNSTQSRIAQIGLISYGSYGVNETFISRGGCSGIYGSLIPNTNSSIDLGSSSKKWANGYFTNINGVAVGSSPKFTDTTYSMTRDAEKVKLTPSSGTAQTVSLNDLINGLTEGTSTPNDNDYYISQYVNGGTTTTTYHRRPMSALWTWIKGKIDTIFGCKNGQSGGTDVTMVTTGDKYDWTNTKASTIKVGTTPYTTTNGVVELPAYPTVPTVNNATLTIKQNNTSKGTFTANQATDQTIDLTDTTYESKQEAQGGTDLSLVTTGEKYTWNHATGTDTIPSGYCDTAGGTAAKVVQLTGYTNTANQVFMLTLVNANTYAGEITLNVNSTGAKTLYINGQASSSSNYTLPAGSYLVSTSSGDKYSVRTDGKQPVNISGSANTVNGYTVEKNVPSNAEFTDTTYESLPEASGGTDLSLVKTGDKWNWNRTFPFKPGLEVTSLDDLVGLMDYSTDKRCFSGVIKITTNIGIGVTGWRRIIAIAQNAVNNGTYDIGMFCMFFPAGSSEFVNYALIDGKTTGNYSVSKTGQFVTNIFESTVQITTAGNGQLNLGNNLASGATGKSRGRLVIFSNTDTHYSDIKATGLSDNRNLLCPDKSGTIAVTSDIHDKYVNVKRNNTLAAVLYPMSTTYWSNTESAVTASEGGLMVTLGDGSSTLSVINTSGSENARLSSAELYFATNKGGVNNATAQRLRLMASNESNYYVDLGTKESTPAWCFAPAVTKKLRLGSPSYLWTTIYAQSGSINTSDRNEKKDIVPLDESAKDFIMALNPVSYKFKDGESGRTHYGMIAQDVEQEMAELGMTAMDFAGFCKDQKTVPYTEEKDGRQIQKDMPVEGQYTYGLRYEEFMAPAIKTIQLLQNQVDAQQQEIDDLKQQLAEIKAMLNGGN